MASNMSDGDATKKNRSSSIENNFNPKNKLRNHKNNSNEKTGIENSNGSNKNKNGQGKQSGSSSSDEGKTLLRFDERKLISSFRSRLEISTAAARIHL